MTNIPKDGKVLLKFSASWCGPCKMLSKVIEGVELNLPVIEIDIDEQFELSNMYQIRNVPTLVLLDNGEEVKRKSGVMQAAQLKEFIND